MTPEQIARRDALKRIGAIGIGAATGLGSVVRTRTASPIVIAGQRAELAFAALSAVTVRITISPLDGDVRRPVPVTGALADEQAGDVIARTRDWSAGTRLSAGNVVLRWTDEPPTIHIETTDGALVQRLTFDHDAPGASFLLSDGPMLGLGEGGPQFDRRGNTDRMINGQGGYHLATNGTRAPIQWLIGTAAGGSHPWAMFIHQPYGTFDFTGTEGKFALPSPRPGSGQASMVNPDPVVSTMLPFDAFIIVSRDPAVIMREYARITGLPELPARWTLGYQQSHRTLAGPEEILGVAHTMREKRLPCDALIYLGTEFTPSGWNTRNGEFTWHPTNFPNPREMVAQLHDEHYRVVLHIVVEGRRLTGSVSDPCTAPALPPGRTADDKWPPDRQVSCYWPAHRPLMDDGVDGWWPDQGDGLDGPSRLNRHRMYWEGTQRYRPNARPYALHRNASAGVQRFGGFIWSGDVQSKWETLKTHVPVAINTGLSGLPYWGTDIGGFYPTDEYTGELYVRWFQFGAFNPLFRSHGRHWHLHTPWGWNGGDGGPQETNWHVDPAQLHNSDVEPICRKYLELRYRLMPYLYSTVRESAETGMPIMRALWLHYPDDPLAVARGDEYLWGRDLLVAPVVEKGATSRALYLPRGSWYDFWTNERIEGGREITRPVDLATMPLYVRAGAVIPMDPVRQYTDEPVGDAPTLMVYPGAGGNTMLYQDDGISFEYRRGGFTKTLLQYADETRALRVSLVAGSRMTVQTSRGFDVRTAGRTGVRSLSFGGNTTVVAIP